MQEWLHEGNKILPEKNVGLADATKYEVEFQANTECVEGIS